MRGSLGSNHVVLYLNIISAIDMLAPTNYAGTNAVSLKCTSPQLPTALEHTMTYPNTSLQHWRNEAQRWQWSPSTPSGGQAISDQQENKVITIKSTVNNRDTEQVVSLVATGKNSGASKFKQVSSPTIGETGNLCEQV